MKTLRLLYLWFGIVLALAMIQQIAIHFYPHKLIEHKVFIDGVVDDKLKPLIKELYSSSSEHHIIIHMSTPGGDAFVGFDLVNAIEHSEAKVTLIVHNYAASMGAILVCGKHTNLELSNDATLLFHTMQVSTSIFTRPTPILTKDVASLDTFTQAIYWKARFYIERNCAAAFTDKEWAAMWDTGENIVMTGAEYKKRMHIK